MFHSGRTAMSRPPNFPLQDTNPALRSLLAPAFFGTSTSTSSVPYVTNTPLDGLACFHHDASMQHPGDASGSVTDALLSANCTPYRQKLLRVEGIRRRVSEPLRDEHPSEAAGKARASRPPNRQQQPPASRSCPHLGFVHLRGIRCVWHQRILERKDGWVGVRGPAEDRRRRTPRSRGARGRSRASPLRGRRLGARWGRLRSVGNGVHTVQQTPLDCGGNGLRATRKRPPPSGAVSGSCWVRPVDLISAGQLPFPWIHGTQVPFSVSSSCQNVGETNAAVVGAGRAAPMARCWCGIPLGGVQQLEVNTYQA
ncbi:hypothetical protein VTJ83DRAFT_2627 [Remersonia thermophila]|uniref:Uncharacterized protein n=1 Tax=Remersonia thermophila TaxID=72144 RepID=A0ABR4DJ95_9PEZI